MLKLQYSKKFKNDFKKCEKQGKNLDVLQDVIEKLANEEKLDEKFKDHALKGKYYGSRECHIEPDLFLIYHTNKDKLILTAVRLGSHSELF